MLGSLIPKEAKFFELFRASAEQGVKGAHAFRAMLDDLEHSEDRSREIKDIEHKGDEITHMTMELLHKTFITPLDRDDIHELISCLDNVLDFIEGASLRIHQYDIKSCPSEAKELADIVVKSTECVKRAIDRIHDLTFTSGIIQECVEINRLENEADHVLRAAKAKLFKDEPDTRTLIKLKEIFEFLESVTDRCEDVADVIEGIVLEYS